MKRQRVQAAARQRQGTDAKLSEIRAQELQQKQRYEDGKSYHKKIVSCSHSKQVWVFDVLLEA